MSSNLLPPNASKTSRALADAFGQALDIPVPNYTLWNPQTCPANTLPWLAWALSVDEWDDNWTEQQKRNAIAASVSVHQKKGTIGALKRALQATGCEVEVNDKTGEAYTFRLAFDLNQTGPLESKTFATAKRVALANKNARSHLVAIDALMKATVGVYVGAAHCRADDISIKCQGIAPYVYQQPQGVGLWVGYPFSISVKYMGTEPVTVQWYKDNSPIQGATETTYSVESATNEDFGRYYALLSNANGSTQSNLVAIASAPLFIGQPQSYKGIWGVDVTFSVDAVGTEPITYQSYRKNGAVISGANLATYTLASVDEANEGEYHCKAVNENGETLSDPATLDIYFEPPTPVTLVNDHPAMVEISWTAYSDNRVNVESYELQYSLNGGSWTSLYAGTDYTYRHYLSVSGTYLYRLRVNSGSRTSDWSDYVTFNADQGVMGGLYIQGSLGSASGLVNPTQSVKAENLNVQGSLGDASGHVTPTQTVKSENLNISATVEGSYE